MKETKWYVKVWIVLLIVVCSPLIIVPVLRQRATSGAVLYSGSKDKCPYQPDKKVLLGKYYYIEAK